MFFIDDATIIQSWQRSGNKTYNRFWGLLSILKQIHDNGVTEIVPVETYKVSGSDVANYLQDIFHFGSDIRVSAPSNYFVTFSKFWIQSINSIFLKGTPNIYDIAIIAAYPFVQEKEFTLEELLERFFAQFNLRREHFTGIVDYDMKQINLRYNSAIASNTTARQTRNSKSNLHQALSSALSVSSTEFNISMDSPYYIAAHPSELTRAPFFQTLYQNPSVQECVLITKFNFADYYPLNPTFQKSIAKSPTSNLARNKIIYGAPGTGKSYELRKQAVDNGFTDENTIRITFHPNFSYQQFVGSYKPTPIYKSAAAGENFYGSDKVTLLVAPTNKEPYIDYSFVQGPFLNQLVKAILNPSNNYLIIIEEINRAPVSSVFGDVFQLLDRDENGDSEYDVEFNAEASSHLRSAGITENKIRLPKNLFIWATMNSADQGVMPMDAAFKRRWVFEYLPLNSKQGVVESKVISFQGRKIKWNHFRNVVNDKLKDLGVAEDKLIGPFFLNTAELANPSSIKNKLLLYLRDDVVRHNSDNLFKQRTFSDIMSAYDDGAEIFNDMIFEEFAEGTEVAVQPENVANQ